MPDANGPRPIQAGPLPSGWSDAFAALPVATRTVMWMYLA